MLVNSRGVLSHRWYILLVLVLLLANAVLNSIRLFLTKGDPTAQGTTTEPHPSPPRIRYTTHPNTKYNETYNLYIRCQDRAPLPPSMDEALHFTTSLHLNNLKILVMGDSVGIQLSQILEESFEMGHEHHQHKVIQYSWGTHEGIHVGTEASYSTSSAVVGWRILGLLLRHGLRKPLPNTPGGGWRHEQVQTLLQYSPLMEQQPGNATTAPRQNTTSLSSFDVVVYRIPHGWMSLGDITLKSVRETVELAHELFGATTIIFLTVPFSNNIQTAPDREKMDETNAMLAGFAADWSVAGNDSPVKHVMLLRLDQFVDDLILANGQALGMISNTSAAKSSQLQDLLQRRCCTLKKKFRRPIAQVCGTPNVTMDATSCEQNSWSLDGMHYCLQAVGGRLVAGIACLIGCVYNNEPESDSDLDQCQRHCNAQFMSLQPIPHHSLDKRIGTSRMDEDWRRL